MVYKTPIAPDQLDPCLFYFPETGEPPRLHPSVHAHIINDIELLCGGNNSRIVKCLIVGNAVTPGKKDRFGDIKVILLLNKNIMDVDVDGLAAEEILKICKALSNRKIVGTMRTIKYVPSVRDLDPSEHKGIYDVATQSWLKIPSGLKNT